MLAKVPNLGYPEILSSRSILQSGPQLSAHCIAPRDAGLLFIYLAPSCPIPHLPAESSRALGVVLSAKTSPEKEIMPPPLAQCLFHSSLSPDTT